MYTVKGVYEDGKIKLSEPIDVEKDTNVIITFLDEDFAEKELSLDDEIEMLDDESEDLADDGYEGMREHKRFPAKGDIVLNIDDEEVIFPLNDYSAGGLSFISDRAFDISSDITATLKYSIGDEELLMDFEMTVRGVFEDGSDGYKIGCQFLDLVDEQLWHTIMG